MAKKEAVVRRELAVIEKDINEMIAAIDEAIEKNDLAAKLEAEESLDKFVKEHADAKVHIVYSALRQKSNPMLEAVKLATFPIGRLVKDDGIPVSFDPEGATRFVDLVKFSEFCSLPLLWKHKVDKMGLLIAARKAKDLKMSPERQKEFIASYFIDDLAKKENMGQTPTSNSQCVKMVQSVIDCILPNCGFKADNHDVVFLLEAFTELDKRKVSTLKVVKNKSLYNIILSMLHVITTNGEYGLNSQRQKQAEKAAERAAKDEQKKAEHSAAEKVLTQKTVKASSPEEKPAVTRVKKQKDSEQESVAE